MPTRAKRRRNARDRNLLLRGRTWYYKKIVGKEGDDGREAEICSLILVLLPEGPKP